MFYIVSSSSHGMHRGGLFPSIKRSESYTYYKWPMCSREKIVSSLLFARGQETQRFSFGMIIMQQMVHSRPTPADTALNGIYSYEILGLRKGWAHLRGRHRGHPQQQSLHLQHVFSVMPIWPGTETKTISFSPLVNSKHSSTSWISWNRDKNDLLFTSGGFRVQFYNHC